MESVCNIIDQRIHLNLHAPGKLTPKQSVLIFKNDSFYKGTNISQSMFHTAMTTKRKYLIICMIAVQIRSHPANITNFFIMQA